MKAFTFFLLSLLPASILGQAFSIITDQDFFYVVDRSKNEDRNYTQGTSLGISNPDLYNSWAFTPFRLINKLSIFKKERHPIGSSVVIIGTAFTPRHIDSINPIVGDRPFSFLLAASLCQVNQIGLSEGRHSRYEAFTLNLGLLGTNLGYNFQSFAHKSIVPGRPVDPKGWNTQISKGGMPTALLNYEYVRSFSTVKEGMRTGVDFSAIFGASLGYYERAFAGAMFRIGRLSRENFPAWAFWAQSLSTGAMLQKAAKDREAISNLERPANFEVFLFTALRANLMGRNALLVGQRISNRNEYTLDPSWVNVGVLELEIGLAHGWYWTNKNYKQRFFRILYKNTFRSAEFNSKIFPRRSHYYGSAGVQFAIP